MLHIHDLTVEYGNRTALEGVTCAAPAGAVVGVVGPNGAGKSTLLGAVAGALERASVRGTVVVEAAGAGAPVAAMCPDSTIGFLDLTPAQNIELLCMAAGLSTHVADAAVSLLDLGADADRRLDDLSLGMRRRTDIVLTVCRPADVYLFDEPYNGLDAAWLHSFRRVLSAVSAAARVAVVASHSMDLLLPECSAVWELAEGRITQTLSAVRGTVSEALLTHLEDPPPAERTLPWLVDHL